MPRVLRAVLGDGLFHVWAVAVDGTPAFADDRDRISFLRLLAECVHGYEWEVYAWCLMTTHYHLVIAAGRSGSRPACNASTASTPNARTAAASARGISSERGSGTRVIDGEKHANEVCRYVLLNPVRAGLVERREDWIWSWCRSGKTL